MKLEKGSEWNHCVFGRVEVVEDLDDCIRLKKESGREVMACGFDSRERMLARFEKLPEESLPKK